MRQSVLRSTCGLIALMLLASVPACAPPYRGLRPGDPLWRCGDEIVAAGRFYHTGAPVVLWLDAKGYDAYRCRQHFDPETIMPKNPASPGDPNRYGTRRNLPKEVQEDVQDRGWDLENTQAMVDQFVIHYDVCGTSARCFKVLQDLRGLSVHFMLDIDGTIYQTLDLKERAWHAGTVNDRSVGVEIAHIGAYRDMKTLNEWYAPDLFGWPCIRIPKSIKERDVRTPFFTGRPARKEVIKGTINGQELMQYDFTCEQYESLIKLTAALSRIFPKLRIDYPRGLDGKVCPDVLSDREMAYYSGLLGHWHVIKSKVDPGPAFDWDRVVQGARRERGMFW